MARRPLSVPLSRGNGATPANAATSFRVSVPSSGKFDALAHQAPQGAGQTMVGVRMNKLFYFKGAVRMARFTRRALTPAEFLKVPEKR